jgi:predicted Zn-dependent protease
MDDRGLAETIRRHEERLARDPESLAFAQLADLYRKAGRTADAIGLCREGLQRWPHYTTARLILAKALLGEGQLEPALVEVDAILQTSPKDVQCHRLAAEAHRRAGRIDAAAGEATGLARVLSDDTFVTLSFGTLCLEQGLADEAAMVLTRVVRRSPDNAEARERLEAALRVRSRRRG